MAKKRKRTKRMTDIDTLRPQIEERFEYHTPENRVVLNEAGWLVKRPLYLNDAGWLVS
jgi:hypothetical protein